MQTSYLPAILLHHLLLARRADLRRRRSTGRLLLFHLHFELVELAAWATNRLAKRTHTRLLEATLLGNLRRQQTGGQAPQADAVEHAAIDDVTVPGMSREVTLNKTGAAT